MKKNFFFLLLTNVANLLHQFVNLKKSSLQHFPFFARDQAYNMDASTSADMSGSKVKLFGIFA